MPKHLIIFPLLIGTLRRCSLLLAGGVLLLCQAETSFAAAPVLTAEDCQKCHVQVLTKVATSGGKHRDAVGCVDCHREHPPRGANAIPSCAMCHGPQKKPHYAVSDCLGCHDPHAPLNIGFQNAFRVAPACQSCHPQQMQELLNYASNHTVLDCNACHPVHKEFLGCAECHAGHLPEQTYSDCRRCHKPHSPLKVVYQNDIGSRHCEACHQTPGEQLRQNPTKHRLFLCVYCHKDQHKRVPACVTCHHEPHMRGIHEKFPDCLSCHIGPHNLVN